MSKQEILAGFDQFSEQLVQVLAESDRLKKQVKELIETNTRLNLENRQLRDLLNQFQTTESDDGHKASNHQLEDGARKTNRRRHLEETYAAGFHVCNELYGKAHDTISGCLDCTELLFRD